VDVGQAEVEHHDVGLVLGGGTQRLGAVRGGDDLVAAGGAVDPQRAQDLGLVVDDQHRGHD
jgi:enoyl-CoA hydratase/carnithine racemase